MQAVLTSRTHKIGSSRMIAIPKALWDALAWRDGSVVAIRQAGAQLIIERVALEKMARLAPSPTGNGQ